MKIALIHDWLLGVAGGEKVLEALYTLYKGSLYTLLKDDAALKEIFGQECMVTSSFLQKFPKVAKYYRNLLPLFPFAIEQFDLSSYDLLLSSSHAVAKGIRKHPHQLHICYCHTPMRYAWDLYDFHLSQLDPFKRVLARPILHYLQSWDRKTHTRVDHFIANSHCVSQRIQKSYGRESTVIYPPVETELFYMSEKKESYYLTCSRLVPYKRVDLLLEAFAKMPDKTLVVIGDGPEMKNLKKIASKNIQLLGYQKDEVLREMLSKAKAFLFAAEEDFGIAAVEAQASGTAVIAYGKAGSLETVIHQKTGLYFNEQTPQSLIDAVELFEKEEAIFYPSLIKEHAESFSRARFLREIEAFITEKWNHFTLSRASK